VGLTFKNTQLLSGTVPNVLKKQLVHAHIFFMSAVAIPKLEGGLPAATTHLELYL
jgi:hypothetical protein